MGIGNAPSVNAFKNTHAVRRHLRIQSCIAVGLLRLALLVTVVQHAVIQQESVLRDRFTACGASICKNNRICLRLRASKSWSVVGYLFIDLSPLTTTPESDQQSIDRRLPPSGCSYCHAPAAGAARTATRSNAAV